MPRYVEIVNWNVYPVYIHIFYFLKVHNSYAINRLKFDKPSCKAHGCNLYQIELAVLY